MHAISLQRVGRHLAQFGHALRSGVQDEVPAEERSNRGAERVESLREIQPAGSGFLRAEHRHVWVRGNLQDGDAACQDHQGAEKQRVRRHRGGRHEEQGAGAHHQDAGHHGALVADGINQAGGRNRKNKVRRKDANWISWLASSVEDRLEVG